MKIEFWIFEHYQGFYIKNQLENKYLFLKINPETFEIEFWESEKLYNVSQDLYFFKTQEIAKNVLDRYLKQLVKPNQKLIIKN